MVQGPRRVAEVVSFGQARRVAEMAPIYSQRWEPGYNFHLFVLLTVQSLDFLNIVVQ